MPQLHRHSSEGDIILLMDPLDLLEKHNLLDDGILLLDLAYSTPLWADEKHPRHGRRCES